MPNVAQQNATSRRGGWSGSGGGGGIIVLPGTDNYFPMWSGGLLTLTSQLYKLSNNALSWSGVVGLNDTVDFKLISNTAGRETNVSLRNAIDNKEAFINFNPGTTVDILAIQSPGQISLRSVNYAASLTLEDNGLKYRIQGPTVCAFGVEEFTAGKSSTIKLSNQIDGTFSTLDHNAGNLVVTAQALLYLSVPSLHAFTLTNWKLEVTSSGFLYMDGAGISFTKPTNDLLFSLVATTANKAQEIAFINTANVKTVSMLHNGGNFTITVPNSFNVNSATSAGMASYVVSLQCTASGQVFMVHPAGGTYIIAGYGGYCMDVGNGADKVIFGPPDVFTTPLPNARMSIFCPTGAGIRNTVHLRTKDAATLGLIICSADNAAKYAAFCTWGSGVGAGYVFGGVAVLNAAGVVGQNCSTLVHYSLNTAGAGYIPLAFGQSASGGDRQSFGVDASGNFWLNAAAPLLFGEVGVTGTRRVNKASVAGEINLEKWDGAAWVSDVGTFQVIGTGTDYTLSSTYAAVVFGTTSPALTITRPGTYLIMCRGAIKSKATGSFTGKSGPGFWVKLYRTNNTPADLTEAFTSCMPEDYATGATLVDGLACPPAVYTTLNTDDAIAMYAKMQTTVASGTFSVYSGSITAVRLR